LPKKLVPVFRGHIIEKVGRSHILFHHHQVDQAVLYKCPLIQYKSIRNKPCIVCMAEGAEELYHLMNQFQKYVVLIYNSFPIFSYHWKILKFNRYKPRPFHNSETTYCENYMM